MGSSFTLGTMHQIAAQLPAMLAATISTVLFSLFIGYLTHKKTGISLASSVLGSTPGGMTQMVVLSEEVPDSDTTVVTFIQTLRLLSVVFIVPFLAIHGLPNGLDSAGSAPLVSSFIPNAELIFGITAIASALVANALNFPTAFLLGPVIGTAVLVLAGFQPPPVPTLLVISAQLFIGVYLGVTTKPANLENWKQLLPYTIGGGIGIVLFSLGAGYLLTFWHNIDIITAFLSTAPGGMTEMGITAINVGADISIITAYQLFRLLFMLIILPPALKWWLGSRKSAENSL
ncbi:hypothetical protein SDC9_120779 [bioreactor metagenome]|uniref:Ammonia monooxygenase n=1 Tax=bioreactor metagenome TaxID=1076179 RepID=A0A645CA40_9ZZZZ